jgi:hypothetical protein
VSEVIQPPKHGPMQCYDFGNILVEKMKNGNCYILRKPAIYAENIFVTSMIKRITPFQKNG